MHQASPASIGVIDSVMSLPYKHNPASKRRISRAPKPASITELFCTFSNVLVKVATCSVGTDI